MKSDTYTPERNRFLCLRDGGLLRRHLICPNNVHSHNSVCMSCVKVVLGLAEAYRLGICVYHRVYWCMILKAAASIIAILSITGTSQLGLILIKKMKPLFSQPAVNKYSSNDSHMVCVTQGSWSCTGTSASTITWAWTALWSTGWMMQPTSGQSEWVMPTHSCLSYIIQCTCHLSVHSNNR